LSNVSEAHSCDEPVVIFFWHLRISDFVHTLKSHQLAKSHIRIKKSTLLFWSFQILWGNCASSLREQSERWVS